ncbi:hypothetical protein Y032_0485g2323 [Ancylostoma ceylanicum]|uniref:Uncharacterized protein n=1 Tax=Ancylostoma ceylanicum TaxID=53326 RepID=A0A016WXB3_9BILA|nr:hypothetical protein Y032_0485g2323 [Ancylostoma ceylanicum]
MTEKHLQDVSLYRKSSADEFQKQHRKLNREWVKIAKTANLSPDVTSRLRNELPVCPVLYLLVKTHKLQSSSDLASADPATFKVRPIISSVGGSTDRIGWFLNTILVQLLRFIPAHSTNTQMFLERLRNTRVSNSCIMESFDVNALYTNVSNEAAMQAISELLLENERNINLHGLSTSQVMVLLKACLECNVFKWSGNYFAQIRGLAMGQRLVPTLAIAFMARVEAPVLECRPLLYCRYIDDCFIICATQAEIDKCFELLNGQSEHIRLSRERPTGEWLPFLNVQIEISSGTHQTKWYRKASNKNILVHIRSAHPRETKKAVIKNMFRTASQVCSGPEEKGESLALARKIATSNGYVDSAAQNRLRRKTHSRETELATADKIPFCIPFISDEVSAAIRQRLRRSSLDSIVSVVEIPPSNLKRILVRNGMYDRACTVPDCSICPTGRTGECMSSGVIYLISCMDCGDEYIGETARPLRVRIKEHLDGRDRSRPSTPLGIHRLQKHAGESFEVSVKILAHESQTSARKTLEAFWTHAKSPEMNRKEECLSITRELAPYLGQLF